MPLIVAVSLMPLGCGSIHSRELIAGSNIVSFRTKKEAVAFVTETVVTRDYKRLLAACTDGRKLARHPEYFKILKYIHQRWQLDDLCERTEWEDSPTGKKSVGSCGGLFSSIHISLEPHDDGWRIWDIWRCK